MEKKLLFEHKNFATMMATHTTGGLNTETTIALSQSMDSVNTTPEEEVSFVFIHFNARGFGIHIVRTGWPAVRC